MFVNDLTIRGQTVSCLLGLSGNVVCSFDRTSAGGCHGGPAHFGNYTRMGSTCRAGQGKRRPQRFRKGGKPTVVIPCVSLYYTVGTSSRALA